MLVRGILSCWFWYWYWQFKAIDECQMSFSPPVTFLWCTSIHSGAVSCISTDSSIASSLQFVCLWRAAFLSLHSHNVCNTPYSVIFSEFFTFFQTHLPSTDSLLFMSCLTIVKIKVNISAWNHWFSNCTQEKQNKLLQYLRESEHNWHSPVIIGVSCSWLALFMKCSAGIFHGVSPVAAVDEYFILW